MLIIRCVCKVIEIKHPFVSFQTWLIIYVFIFADTEKGYCQQYLICMNVK